MKKLNNPFVLEFLLPAIISVCFAYFFKWEAKELVWSFWAASYILSLIFCLLALMIVGDKTGDRSLATFGTSFFIVFFIFFHQYAAYLIASSSLVSELSNDNIEMLLAAVKQFYPFLIVYIFTDIRKLYDNNLSFFQKVSIFLAVFIRLQILAWFCVFFAGRLPVWAVYLITYFICFMPLDFLKRGKHDSDTIKLSQP